MYSIIRARSRLCSLISKPKNRRLLSSSSQPVEPTISASSTIREHPGSDHIPPPPAEAPPPSPSPSISSPPPPAAGKKSSGFLKAGLFAALTGGVAAVGYAPYAYTSDEIREKTKTLRACENYTVPEDASDFDKYKGFLFSGAMTVPAKMVEVYLDLRRFAEDQIRGFSDPPSDKLLPDLAPEEQHVFTLVLDLNETLIYCDWKRERGWTTFKRPGVDGFLEHLSQFYEIVLYTDQMTVFLDPVLQKLDPQHFMRYRLDRVSTRYMDGKHYRDLSILNRDPARVLYLSGHAVETTLQPENAVPIKPWMGEPEDTALLDLIPFLEFVAKARPNDIRTVLASYRGLDIPKEFIERSKAHHRRLEEQKQTKRKFWQQ